MALRFRPLNRYWWQCVWRGACCLIGLHQRFIRTALDGTTFYWCFWCNREVRRSMWRYPKKGHHGW